VEGTPEGQTFIERAAVDDDNAEAFGGLGQGTARGEQESAGDDGAFGVREDNVAIFYTRGGKLGDGLVGVDKAFADEVVDRIAQGLFGDDLWNRGIDDSDAVLEPADGVCLCGRKRAAGLEMCELGREMM